VVFFTADEREWMKGRST